MIDIDEARVYAPVLERAVDLLGAESLNKMKFGEALLLASAQLKIEIPKHMEGPLLTTLFKIFSAGKLPGFPDA